MHSGKQDLRSAFACSYCVLTSSLAVDRCIAEELGEDSSAKFTFTLVKRPGAAELPTPAGVRVEIRDPLAARIYLGTLGQVSRFHIGISQYQLLPSLSITIMQRSKIAMQAYFRSQVLFLKTEACIRC
jgi:hypothetical protein